MAKRALNFSKMDLAELLQLRDEIETALNGKIAMERQELQSKMAELAALERKRSKAIGRDVSKPKTRKRAAASRTPKPHPLKGRRPSRYTGGRMAKLGRGEGWRRDGSPIWKRQARSARSS